MIITYPTGLYEDVGDIPTTPSQSGNITFTISSQAPTRSSESFLQLPIAEEVRKRSPMIFSELDRRSDQGELVYTVVRGSQVDAGSAVKLFEIGQFLEFADEVIESVDDTLAPDTIDIMHFTNLLDLEAAGLTTDEIENVLAQAFEKQKELEGLVASLQVGISGLEAAIVETQKSINETNKIINALVELGTTDTSLVERLSINLTTLIQTRSTQIQQVNTKKSELEEAYNSLLKVSELVR